MQKPSMPIAVGAGGPGWKARRNRVMRVSGALVAVLMLAAALPNWDDEPAGAGSATFIGVLLLMVAIPQRRPSGATCEVIEDGRPMVAIPMRPLAPRIAVGLSLVGSVVLVGSGVGAWRALPDQALKGIALALVGGGMGLIIAALGLINLLPRARRPKPILVADDGVGWLFAGKRQWARWDEIAVVEPWWTPIGFGFLRPTANQILLRGHDGEPVTAFRVSLLNVDPELALRAVCDAHAAALRKI